MAAVRLYQTKDEFGDKVHLDVKAYPLIPGDNPRGNFTPHDSQGRMRAGVEAKIEGLKFQPWPDDKPRPGSSMPALEAAKCALSQGEDRFRAYDLGLFKAFFEECQDISAYEVLVDVASGCGLDLDRFTEDLSNGNQRQNVMSEFLQCLSQFGSYAQGVPLATFNNSPPLVGCPPVEVYRTAIMRQLEPLTR